MTNAEKYNVKKDDEGLYPCPPFVTLQDCIDFGDCDICKEWWEKTVKEPQKSQ